MKKLLALLLLTSSLAFAQKFQDVTAKGAQVSLGVRAVLPDMGPYAAVRNNSSKGILAFVVIVKSTDEHGQEVPCTGRADFVFKSVGLATKEERFACLMDPATPG